MKQRSERPVVEVPDRGTDRPVWSRVGVIAVVGFIIGIAWPRLAGVTLGPAPPDDEVSKASSLASEQIAAAVSAHAAPAVSASAQVGPKPVEVQTVIVKKTDVLSCRDANGKPVDKCDRPDFDTLLMPQVKGLEKCPSAAGLAGKLSVGFEVDFGRDRIRVLRGKSTTIPHTTVAGIWSCADDGLKSAKLAGLKHDQVRYTVFYAAHFYPPGKIVDPGMADDKPERDTREGAAAVAQDTSITGAAQVVYDTVLVRDDPKTGKVVARLVRGTRVELLSKQGSWYRIRFNDREGWVYRGAIAQ
jgi:hypothetical protein